MGNHDHHNHQEHQDQHQCGHGHHHFHDVREGNKKGLIIAIIITASIMFLEFFGGLYTNSLALLSDAGHMLSDSSALLLSFVAIWFASRPATPNKTYGFYRFEILAALFNGITLFVIAGFIIHEAYQRILEPPTVAGGVMMLIAFIGLLANLLSAWVLMRKGDVKHNINMRSAYLHILGDALGSVGAIIAGFLMIAFSWYLADPIISVVVALLIIKSAWSIIVHSVNILMESAPSNISHTEIVEALEYIDGVLDVHDLHVWTITSGFPALSCHIRIQVGLDCQDILQKAIHTIEQRFKIDHVTIQIETDNIQHNDLVI
ncbi:zinc transporter ZitB [Desulfuribacillus stibiiarsenatis]|uniref:Zinc transporter ZitB n=1 Tax=Desulfuribacillus stibiiarsenatis TaxID=1390249 RepID=A0A1E5L4Q1_9FIRM|nr:cation diffusion facilitator family transporter [Desulfuribacillus stibiiarsenatis]OEH85090.1 zinc transporter ZitB [Desulfuribacillus stibiiarsenatis]